VLGHLGDDVVAALAIHLRDALDGQVVALRGAGGEDDLLGGGPDQLGNLLARRFHSLLRFPSKRVVAAGRVPELRGEVRHHRFQHPRIQRAGGVIIHINRQGYTLPVLPLGWQNCAHLDISILVLLLLRSARRGNHLLKRQCNQSLRLSRST
jgi:hypothetical protein